VNFAFRSNLVSKDVFLEHFWWCWDRFQAAVSPEVPLPAYFRFLTLLALRIFIAEKVSSASFVVPGLALLGPVIARNHLFSCP
jgi:hypothetical protein